MDKWEYRFITYNDAELETQLAALGEQGWEAVGFAPVRHDDANRDKWGWGKPPRVTEWVATEYRLLLKRHKP